MVPRTLSSTLALWKVSTSLECSYSNWQLLTSNLVEIHNKQSDSYTVVAQDCINYLNNLAAENSPCFGPKHHDTTGGTWQVGKNILTFHALSSYL